MAKTNVESWSLTAADNGDIDGINIGEGCPAAGINNAIRAMMAQVKAAFATASQLLAASAAHILVSPKALFDACAWTVLADGATITPNQNDALNFTVTLGGNRAFANMSNTKPGSGGFLRVKQDATGGRTLSWGSHYRFPRAAGNPPGLTAAANAVDIFSYVIFDSATVYVFEAKDMI